MLFFLFQSSFCATFNTYWVYTNFFSTNIRIILWTNVSFEVLRTPLKYEIPKRMKIDIHRRSIFYFNASSYLFFVLKTVTSYNYCWLPVKIIKGSTHKWPNILGLTLEKRFFLLITSVDIWLILLVGGVIFFNWENVKIK